MAFDMENTPTNNTLWCVRFMGCSGKGPTDAIFIHPVQMGEALYQGGWFSQLPGQLVQRFTGINGCNDSGVVICSLCIADDVHFVHMFLI